MHLIQECGPLMGTLCDRDSFEEETIVDESEGRLTDS